MTDSQIQKGLLPAGLSDILYPKAQVQAKKIETLLDVFSNYGYLRVKPPLVEYEETLLSDGPGTVLKDSTFRIMDPLSQKMMALRSDVTAQISRIASTRLSHLARPLRLSYSGDVLRVKGDSFNTERQKTQVGAELIGLENEFCDAEIILICLKALKSIDIENITIDINLPFLHLTAVLQSAHFMTVFQLFCVQFQPDFRSSGLTENFFQLTTTMNYDHLFGPLNREWQLRL